MKKILFSILLAGSALTASAQSSGSVETSFGFKGGVNFANVQLSQSGSSSTYNTGSLTNFSAGLFADIGITESFSIQPGVFYSGKGFKLDGIEASTDLGGISYSTAINTKAIISYMQVPVNFLFNATTNAGQFFVGGGPFAAVAVKAKEKGSTKSTVIIGGTTTTETESYDNEITIGDADGIKRTDFGVTGLAGFKFNNGFSVSANYDLGLTNISGASNDEGKMKTRTYGISIGFSF